MYLHPILLLLAVVAAEVLVNHQVNFLELAVVELVVF
jgi:hypothetical protein